MDVFLEALRYWKAGTSGDQSAGRWEKKEEEAQRPRDKRCNLITEQVMVVLLPKSEHYRKEAKEKELDLLKEFEVWGEVSERLVEDFQTEQDWVFKVKLQFSLVLN